MYACLLIQLAIIIGKPNPKPNKLQDQGRVLYLTLHGHGAKMAQRRGFMVASHGRGRGLRWWMAMDGRRWSVKWPENGPMHSSAQNRVGAILAFVGPLVGILVAAHYGGGVGQYWGENMVAMDGRESDRKALEKSHSTGGRQCD